MKELCQRTWKKARNVYNKVRQWKANYKCEAGGNAVHPAEMGRTMRKSTCDDVFLEVTILCAKNMVEDEKGKLKELENILINIKIE